MKRDRVGGKHNTVAKRGVILSLVLVIALAFSGLVPAGPAINEYAAGAGGEKAAVLTPGASAVYADENEENLSDEEKERREFLDKIYNIPVASNRVKGWPKAAGTYGEAACVMDMETGAFLYNKKMLKHLYPASITKIMTAYCAIKYGDLKGKVQFYPEDISFLEPGDASIGMKPGEIMPMKDSMYAMLLQSANEVSHAIIRTVGRKVRKDGKIKVPGAPKKAENEQELDYQWGIAIMNWEAGMLGCTNSHFTNANGLHNKNHYVCAHDMCLIGAAAYQYQYFRKVTQTLYYTIPQYEQYRYVDKKTGKEISRKKYRKLKKSKNRTKLKSIKRIKTGLFTVAPRGFSQYHKMLYPNSPYYYEACTGGKTGFTDQAGTTLVTFAEKNGRKLVCTCLHTYGAENVYNDTRNLLEYGFNKFKVMELSPDEITKVANSKKNKKKVSKQGIARKVTMIDTDKVRLTVPKKTKLNKITSTTQYDFSNFSLSSGQLKFVVGNMTVGSIGVHFESLSASVKNALNRAREAKNESGGE